MLTKLKWMAIAIIFAFALSSCIMGNYETAAPEATEVNAPEMVVSKPVSLELELLDYGICNDDGSVDTYITTSIHAQLDEYESIQFFLFGWGMDYWGSTKNLDDIGIPITAHPNRGSQGTKVAAYISVLKEVNGILENTNNGASEMLEFRLDPDIEFECVDQFQTERKVAIEQEIDIYDFIVGRGATCNEETGIPTQSIDVYPEGTVYLTGNQYFELEVYAEGELIDIVQLSFDGEGATVGLDYGEQQHLDFRVVQVEFDAETNTSTVIAASPMESFGPDKVMLPSELVSMYDLFPDSPCSANH